MPAEIGDERNPLVPRFERVKKICPKPGAVIARNTVTPPCALSQPARSKCHPRWSRRSSKPIFRPRIGRIRVAAHFPEAEDVPVEKDNFADELRPFPRVTLRDDQGIFMLL